MVAMQPWQRSSVLWFVAWLPVRHSVREVHLDTMSQTSTPHHHHHERWGTRLGAILAVAGSAVGLGNFLRYPTQVAQNGGGAFLIPYIVALLLIGLPLMWLEWSMGRYGGSHGKHNLPAIFSILSPQRRWMRYLGVLGLFMPLVISVYYTYVTSWMLGYSVMAASGIFHGVEDKAGFVDVLNQYLGAGHGPLSLPTWGLVFLVITFALGYRVLWHGVSRGIERLVRVAMPLLFVCAVALAIRVLTIPGSLKGLEFLFRPDLSVLSDPKVWLAGAGQVFFTLSVGMGAIVTYGSYVGRNEDTAKAGLTAAGINTFAEVVLGSCIAIPIAVAVFGAKETIQIAQGSPVAMAVISMPLAFEHIPMGQLFGSLWFLLLFLAGLTSLVSLTQVVVAFLQDEFQLSRHRAVNAVHLFSAFYLILVVIKQDVFIDDMDFWSVNIALPVCALLQVVVFQYSLGWREAWAEITRNAAIRVPVIFRYILAGITPIYLLVLLGLWAIQQGWGKLMMDGVDAASKPWLIASRVIMVAILAGFLWLLRLSDTKPVAHAPAETK